MSLQSDIRGLRSKYSLFRYLQIKVELSNLPQYSLAFDKETRVEYAPYTSESVNVIKQLVHYGIQVYNATHPDEDEPVRFEEAFAAVKELFEDDRKALMRERSIEN